MEKKKPTFGLCPLSPTGDVCSDDCALWVISVGHCAFLLIAYKLAGLDTSLTLIANIFERESQ